MKSILSFLFLLSFLTAFCQDTSKIKEINLLVSVINTSTLPVQRDTLVKDHPEMGLKMTTYLTMIVNNNHLLKYVNYVITTRNENGVQKQMTGSNTFYYNQNKLIKVEEYLIEGDKKQIADWYYSEEKPLYYTLQSDKSEARAALLLTMSQAMLKQIIK
jgi:hypothetical protein